MTAIFVSEQLECFGVLTLNLWSRIASMSLVRMLPSLIGLISWRSTTSCSHSTLKHSIPSIQVWPGVGGFCLFDVVERAIRRFCSLEPDLVELLVRLLHFVVSTQLTQYGGSFFEVTWSLSIGLQCASELANLYLDVLDSHVWQGSEGALKCLFRYIDDGFGVLDSRKNLSPRVAASVEWLECLHQSALCRDLQPASVSGFGSRKTCAGREKQKVWCQVLPHFARSLKITVTCLEIRTITRV